MKSLHWYNDGLRETLRAWPEQVKKGLGHQMRDVQHGDFPQSAKWWNDVGPGVIQLKEKGYRTIVTVAFDDAVWVVHAFEKDSARGKATRKRHKDIVRERVADLERRHSGIKRDH